MALSGNESTSQLTSHDLETLANLQAELDRIGSSITGEDGVELPTEFKLEQEDASLSTEVETSAVTISSSSTFKVVNSGMCADVENVIVESQTPPAATPSPPNAVVDLPIKLDISKSGALDVNTTVTKDSTLEPKVLKPFFIIPSRTLGVTASSSASGEDTVNRLIFTTTNPISAVSSSGASKPVLAPKSLGDGKTLPAVVKGQFITSTSSGSGGSPVITKLFLTQSPLQGQSSTQTMSLAPGTPLATAMASAGPNAVITGLSQPLKIVTASPGHVATTSGKTVTLTQSAIGSPVKPQILTAIPNTPSKQTIMVSKIALSPKTPTKILIPVSVSKSPQKIAPAPVGSGVQLVTKANILTSLTAASTTTTMTTTAPKIGTLAVSPSKLFIKQPVSQAVTVKQCAVPSVTSTAVTNNTGTNIKQISVSTSTGIQVPGSKFSYIRLVTAAAPSATTTTAGSKTTVIAPATVSRPFAPVTSNSSVQTSQQQPLQVSASSQVKIAVPIAPVTSGQLIGQPRVAPKHMAGQRILIPATNVTNVTQIRPTSGSIAVPASALTQLPPGTTLFSPSGNIGNIVMVPAQYVTQFQQQASQGTSTPTSASATVIAPSSQPTILPAQIVNQQNSVPPPSSSSSSSASSQERSQSQPSSKHQINGRPNVEPNGVRPRKPCNCTKSQCLKLYCDCFANGEFCHNCNCNNCYNNLEHEEERQKAIKACLERNPQAFHPKIGKGRDGDIERRHNKGCNCKRSGCLKNYCECYEAKIMCSYMCKCVGCKNIAESAEKKTLMHLADAAEVRVQQQTAAKSKLSFQMQDVPSKPPIGSASGERLPSSFITTEVVEATCQCLLAQAETAKEKAQSEVVVEQLVLQEFGRCLLQIIEYASKTKI